LLRHVPDRWGAGSRLGRSGLDMPITVLHIRIYVVEIYRPFNPLILFIVVTPMENYVRNSDPLSRRRFRAR